MARKHRKQGIVKQSVERIVSPLKERKVVLNPVTNEYEVVTSTVKQGKAQGPTTKRGKPNEMPSKGGFKGTPLKGGR